MKKYFLCIYIHTNKVKSSATGTASQAPVIPRKFGRIRSEAAVNTSVRQNDIIADTFPFESYVKKPDETILIPLSKKLIANILKPVYASS